jgi:glycosidase
MHEVLRFWLNRGVDGRDPERSPMPWRRPSLAGPGVGFTTAEPWLPVATEAAARRDPN